MAGKDENIKKIYTEAIHKIKKLKREHNKVLEDFIKKLEEYKIEKIKENLK